MCKTPALSAVINDTTPATGNDSFSQNTYVPSSPLSLPQVRVSRIFVWLVPLSFGRPLSRPLLRGDVQAAHDVSSAHCTAYPAVLHFICYLVCLSSPRTEASCEKSFTCLIQRSLSGTQEHLRMSHNRCSRNT